MDLLKQLYCIHSPFYREWPMICFIREYIREHVPDAEVRMDSWGNLYIKKGESDGYPTLVCHLDQVLDLAISQDNQYLAKKVLKMYKQNIINEEDAYKKDNSDDYKVKRTWADKEAAIAKCKEAGISL